jgi:quercetin 2,3-dioxygenase
MLVHLSHTRGFADHGWLKSAHTFSFADYYDPSRMGFGSLRVINDDFIKPQMGFGTHPHRDMEIITIPLEGVLKHKDSEGHSSLIRKGEVQIMSAGTGIAHSEVNGSDKEAVKLLQIWVLPKKLGVKPRYEQKSFSHADRQNKFQLIVSPEGSEDSVLINQDAFFSLSDLNAGRRISYQKKKSGNGLYLFVIKGEVEVKGKTFEERDAVGIEDFDSLDINSRKDSELLLMEVPL